MNQTKNDLNVIQELVGELRPQKPLLSASKRLSIVVLLHTLIVIGIMNFIQEFRPNFAQDFFNPLFSLEILLGVFSLFGMVYFSLLSVVPGAVKQKNIYFAALLFVLLIVLIAKGIFAPHVQASMVGKRSTCLMEVLSLGTLPYLHLLYLFKRGFFMNRFKTFFAASLGCATIPGLLMHFACMYEPLHILKFHMAPIIIFALLASGITYFTTGKSDRI